MEEAWLLSTTQLGLCSVVAVFRLRGLPVSSVLLVTPRAMLSRLRAATRRKTGANGVTDNVEEDTGTVRSGRAGEFAAGAFAMPSCGTIFAACLCIDAPVTHVPGAGAELYLCVFFPPGARSLPSLSSAVFVPLTLHEQARSRLLRTLTIGRP